MAVSGIVLGAVGTLLIVGLVVGGVWLGQNIITPDNAEVGMCVDTDEDGGAISMMKADCDESTTRRSSPSASYSDADAGRPESRRPSWDQIADTSGGLCVSRT